MTKTHNITVVLGPTAIGKSAYAIKLAKKNKGEIISADAFQVYRHMNIGTAKILPEEQQGIPHHLIDILDATEPWSVGDFLRRTDKILDTHQAQGTHSIICGGTGLYLQAFLYGYTLDQPPSDPAIRNRLNAELETEGLAALVQQLEAIDPRYAEQIDLCNPKRVLRALEIAQVSGKKPSEVTRKHDTQRDDVTLIGLSADRNIIYDRIHQRVDKMFENGLLDEIKHLLSLGVTPQHQAFEAIGYKEPLAHLNGQMSYDDMVELVKTRTRQFAKRQMTWFRRFKHVQWIDISELST